MWHKFPVAFIFLVSSGLSHADDLERGPPQFAVTKSMIDGGGGRSQNQRFIVQGSVAPPRATFMSGGPFEVNGDLDPMPFALGPSVFADRFESTEEGQQDDD